MKKIKIIAVLIGFLIVHSSFSQGDDCSTAIQLTTLKDYCSTGGLYTNATATAPGATGFAQATCWTNATQNIDVWFKFVSVGTDVMITVKGSGLSTGATLNKASIALYSGDCATSITEHKCSMSTASNLTSMYQGALDLAKTYYIRVTTTSANIGKFDLCINNFNPVQNPNSPNDCDKGTIICNKDVVSVGLLDSYGSNTTEHKLTGSCMSSSNEANSTWLEFKCSTSGTLDFDLSGTDITNDLDWILMEIPALRSCATRTTVSCSLASCDINQSQSSSNVERKTGLRAGEDAAALNNGSGTTKDSEGGGCTSPSNGYNNTLNITAGKTYALFINNFTGVQGFAISWGGTSKFQGPEPDITVDKTTICIGESIQASGATSTAGTYTSLEWTMPSVGVPTTYSGVGPFPVTFNKTGIYPLILKGLDAQGCINVVNKNITVIGIPTITVNSPTICSGQTATLTASGGATYSWTGGSTTNPYTVSPTTTTNYTVTGTTSGCSSTAIATVTVNTAPTITVNSPTICTGQTATLTASGGTTYAWTGGPSTSTYGVTPTAASTTYTVTGTTNGCSNTATATVTIASGLAITVNSPIICEGQSATLTAIGGTNYTWTGGAITNPYIVSPTTTTSYTVTGETNGCTGTAIATVTVNTIPTITVNSPIICAGQSATLTASGGTTYSWTGGSTTNPYTVTPTTITNYTVTGTTSGCSSTAIATVTVNTVPTITVNSSTICDGQTATLTASGGTTYSWTGGPTTNPYTVSPTTTTSYTVTGTTNGCSNTATASVVVNFTPILTVNSPIICQGETATLIASGGTTYLWSDGVTTSNNTVSPTSSTTYTVTSNNGGCTSTSTTSVTVNSSPTLVASNPAEVCQPATVDITDPKLISGGSTGAIITYCSNSAGSILLTSPNSIRNSGTYYIKSTQNGCSTVVPIIVKVNPKPKANFVPTPPNVTTIDSKSIMLNTSLNAVDYSWIFSDGTVSSDMSPEHEFPNKEQSKQVVILIATSDAGCKDTTNKIINVNEEVIYYIPNTFTPDDDDFNQVFKPVFTSGFDPSTYHLEIFNRWGELVFESNDTEIGWAGLYGKDGVMVQEGSYTWKIDFKLKENDTRKIEVGSVNILK